jgi:hypothetical protein
MANYAKLHAHAVEKAADEVKLPMFQGYGCILHGAGMVDFRVFFLPARLSLAAAGRKQLKMQPS